MLFFVIVFFLTLEPRAERSSEREGRSRRGNGCIPTHESLCLSSRLCVFDGAASQRQELEKGKLHSDSSMYGVKK